MISLGRLQLICTVLIYGLMLCLGACTQSETTPTGHPSNTMEETMNLMHDDLAAAIPAMDAAVPKIFETATFGLGWFWGIDAQFGVIEGVIRTRVGYAGGRAMDPTYGNMGDHTESVQIDYDPQRIAYTDLLRIFWDSHHPGERAFKPQYMNAIFYHNEQQRQTGLASKAAIENRTGRTVNTPVLSLRAFYRAEDYHQKYLLNRRSGLAKELIRIYPDQKDYVDSTAVARINGYVGGHGDAEQLKGELEALGLSRNSQLALVEMVKGRRRGIFN